MRRLLNSIDVQRVTTVSSGSVRSWLPTVVSMIVASDVWRGLVQEAVEESSHNNYDLILMDIMVRC